MKIADVTPKHVNQAVAAFIAALPADGSYFNSHRVYREVYKSLSITTDGVGTWTETSLTRLLDDRVKRALDSAVQRGELVKLGKWSRHPDNSRVRGVVYYTPASHVQATANALAAWEELAEISRRWAVVRERLAAAGVEVAGDEGSPAELTLEQWELLSAALAGPERRQP